MRPSPTPETPDTPDAAGARASWLGFRVPFEILVAPGRAFADIAARPMWIAPYLIVVLAGWAYIALIGPALDHLERALPPPDGFAGKPASELGNDLRDLVGRLALNEIFSTLFTIGLTTTVFAVVARFKRCGTSLNAYAALATNCLIPSAIGSVLSGLVTAAHPATSFHDIRGLMTALPDNLALFADPGHPSEAFFLGSFDVFTLWSTILLAYGFAALTPVKFATALALAFGLTLASSLIIF